MNEHDLINATRQSFKVYRRKENSSTSNEKTHPLHGYLGRCVANIFGSQYITHYKDGGTINNNELTVNGAYYLKDVDIAVTYCNICVFCLGVKFAISSYSKNANNYFESMMGETANIQVNQIP